MLTDRVLTEPEEEDEDNMEEISAENIVPGGRDRKPIDYVKAANDQANDLDDDEDDDEDFQPPADDTAMEE